MIDFLWWPILILLLIIPVLSISYEFRSRRNLKTALLWGQRPPRRLPAIIFLASLAMMIVASSRPTYAYGHFVLQNYVILAIDVSGSMEEEDILPTRLGASKLALIEFSHNLNESTSIGVLAFSESAVLVQGPTFNRNEIAAALNRLNAMAGTAVGDAILDSIDMIDPVHAKQSAIVLISDGQSNTGIKPLAAAAEAKKRGIRVYTIGIGTHHAAVYLNSLDEESLVEIARITGGEYRRADEIKTIGQSLNELIPYISWINEKIEISYLFSGIGLILLIYSIGITVKNG